MSQISYLWFSGKDGWQVTSFDPRTDKAIGVKSDIKMYINYDAYEALRRERDELYEALEELKMCGPDDGVWERADAVLDKYAKL